MAYYNFFLVKKNYNLCMYVFWGKEEEKKRAERIFPNITSNNLQVVGFSVIFTFPYTFQNHLIF